MDIYQVLRDDHARILGLLERLCSLGEAQVSTAQALIEDLSRELTAHSRAEEAVFYNSLRKCADEEALGLHGFAEHVEIEALLHTLQVFGAFNIVWTTSLDRLARIVREHFRHEEETLFAVARLHFTEDEAQIIGSAFTELSKSAGRYGLVESSLQFVANLMPGRFALNVDVLKRRLLAGSRESLGH